MTEHKADKVTHFVEQFGCSIGLALIFIAGGVALSYRVLKWSGMLG